MPAIKMASREDRDQDLISGGSQLVDEANYATVSHVRTHFADVIDASRRAGAKTLITERSKPAAAVVPVVEFRILQLFEKAGLIERLSELTYKDISVDQALAEIGEILTGPAEFETQEGKGDGHDSAVTTERAGVCA